MTPDDRYTFKQLLEIVPCRERTLRYVVAQLGYYAPPGRKKMFFTEIQKNRILKELTCSSSLPQESAVTNIGLRAGGYTGGSLKKAQAQRTRRMLAIIFEI